MMFGWKSRGVSLHIIKKTMLGIAFAVLASAAQASVFIDRGPPSATDYGNELINQAEAKTFTLGGGRTSVEEQQNILTRFTIGSAMTLNGIDIFTATYGNPNIPGNLARPIGTPVTIKIRADAGGRPSDTNLVRLLSTINETSAVFPDITARHMRIHANFTDTMLAPGTYWIGMSGTNISVNWMHFYDASRADETYNLFGERVNFKLSPDFSASFRLHGFETVALPTSGAVPEPASWAILVIGFGMTGAVARRRHRIAIA